jgi:protocatechuate 3,4-dioxygenase beta subunit
MMGTLGVVVLTGCGPRTTVEPTSNIDSPPPRPATAGPPLPAATAAPIVEAPVCALTPEATAGPFYYDAKLVRSDIAEDRLGAPLLMAVKVVRANENCAPLNGALVDLWHADAGGIYSGFDRQLGGLDTSGQTFLRGIQPTDANGVAEFETIYPGWYPGRAVHIHFKVHYEDTSFVTSQFYFPDELSDRVYAKPPYSGRLDRDTRNEFDSVLRGDPAEQNLIATITENPDGYAGAITVGVAF